MLLLLLLTGLPFSAGADADARYKRNGEVYLLIGKNSDVPGVGQIDYRGVWRLNNPEGIFSGVFPQYLIGQVDIQDLAVDLNRTIFTLSAPKQSTIGADFKLKRQVLDNGVTKEAADIGCHSYIHMDHRGAYWGYQTNIYRTGPALRNIIRSGGGAWPGFKSAGPGDPTTEPSNPAAYLPKYSNPKLQLDYYAGKKWYEIPNGAWYSSWKYVKGCGWFYQVFADQVSGTQYDWTLDKWAPDATATAYSKQAGSIFATTYDMSIKRATLAGCLDGCGGASGNESIKSDEMIFSSAFMPIVDSSGKTVSRTYFYSRPKGKSRYDIITTGQGSGNYVLKGDPVGYGNEAPDTQWLGVSMRDGNSDYLYCLGNSVMKNWITAGGANAAGVNISAVAVSNQWSQKGGIIFAFDETEKMVYKFERDETGSNRNTAFPISTILQNIGAAATSHIDDLKADGDGNMFIGLSFPGLNLTTRQITANWTNNNAYLYEIDGEVNDEGFQNGRLLFKQDFRKSVFRISAMGEPPREEGNRVFATRVYAREISMSPVGWKEIKAAGPMPNTLVAGIVASWTSGLATGTIGPFVLHENSSGNDPGQCRLAVINVPKPPDVLSLRDKLSFLDIIGAYKDQIPMYDPNERTTNQDQSARFAGPLNTRVLYFYMVENYPVPTGAQNPSIQPDYDGDGRYGGFVSTIKNPNPSTDPANPGSIRYYWRTWLVEDQYGNAVCPPEPMSDPVAGSYFHWFYTPIRGKFIVTCRVNYDWYDYSLLPFGTTITQFMANPGAAHKLNENAIPSKNGTAHELSGNRLGQIMGTADFAFMAASASMYLNAILGNDGNSSSYALEPVVVTDVAPAAPVDPREIARVQRCDKPGNDPLTAANWYPQTADTMNPPGGFHGVRAGTEYHWRMDVASQAIFFQDLEQAKNSINYNMLADKLMNPSEPAYFVNTVHEFRFTRTGDDIRWSPGSQVTIEAYLKYPVPPLTNGNPKIVQVDLGSNRTLVPAQNFAYFTTAGNLPPTDPFEAELVIEMSRLFLYDMRIFHVANGNERLLGKVPNLPKKLTITAKAKVLITDTVSPAIAFDKTVPCQLFGLTGSPLIAGTNGNPAAIRFQVTDNDPWDGVTGISPHTAYASENLASNKTIITTCYFRPGSAQYNLKPVFNHSNRGVQLSYSIPSLNSAHNVVVGTAASMPGYGSFVPGTGLGTPATSWSEDPVAKTFSATFDFTVPLNTINNGTMLQLPKWYANNTPGYEPYKFRVSARDSSGNETLDNLLNLVVHVKDDIPPDPYGIVREFKGNTTARFPGRSGIANDDQFATNFESATAFNEGFISRGSWLPGGAGTGRDGEIWDGGNTGLTALWSISDSIVALPDAARTSTITPGSIQVEDNVETLLQVGAADNAGAATATLTFRYFDINGTEQSQSTGSASFTLAGSNNSPATSTLSSARMIFREGSSTKFPLAVPILIQASDNALDWDHYTGCNYTPDGGWSWGTFFKGSPAPNRRLFKTTLPIYGSDLNVRTIERGLRSPGK